MSNNQNHQTVTNNDLLVEKIRKIITNTVDNLNRDLDYYIDLGCDEASLIPAIGYVRYSSHKQQDKHSIEIQKKEIMYRAKEEGYYIILWCIDESVSATHNRAINRPWMRVLFQASLIEEFQGAIFFYDDSRTSRQTTDFVLQVHKPLLMLKPYLKFFCADYHGIWNPDDPLIQVRSLINREKSIELRNKILDYHNTTLSSQRRPASHLPYGYVKGTESDPKIDISDGQAYVVFLIFYLSSWAYSNITIARFLNKCKIPSPNGKEWNQGTIDKILHNKFYLGATSWNVRESRENSKRKPDGQYTLFPDTHISIIPHYLAVIVDETRDLKATFGQKMDTPFTLKGLIRCAKCNCILENKDTTSGRSKSKRRVYRCNSCKEYINIDTIHQKIFDIIFNYLSNNKSQMQQGSKGILSKWIKVLKERLKKIDQEREFVIYQERTFDYDLLGYEKELKHEMNLMLSEIESLKKEVYLLINQINKLLNDTELDLLFNQFFQCKQNSLSQSELRCFMLHFISEIKYDFKTDKQAIQFSKTPFLNVEKWMELITI